MAAEEADGAAPARYTYRLRVSATAYAALPAEWGRCRWIWNECVSRSKKAHVEGKSAVRHGWTAC